MKVTYAPRRLAVRPAGMVSIPAVVMPGAAVISASLIHRPMPAAIMNRPVIAVMVAYGHALDIHALRRRVRKRKAYGVGIDADGEAGGRR